MWIGALTLAVNVGGNLFQAVVIDPVWSGNPPESIKAFAASPYLNQVLIFHRNPFLLMGLLCLLASPFLAWKERAMRRWLLIAVGCYFAVFISTVLFFGPVNQALFFPDPGHVADPATAIAMTRRWVLADRVRYAFRLAAFLSILRAMVLSGAASVSRDLRASAAEKF